MESQSSVKISAGSGQSGCGAGCYGTLALQGLFDMSDDTRDRLIRLEAVVESMAQRMDKFAEVIEKHTKAMAEAKQDEARAHIEQEKKRTKLATIGMTIIAALYFAGESVGESAAEGAHKLLSFLGRVL